MTEHRLAAIASVIFLLAAAFSGGSAVLFLQDSETVTFGNVGNTGPSATESGVEELSTSTNWSEEDGVLVALEPADNSTTAGDNVTYDVVVKGATEGIAGYGVYASLNDSTVASFESFDPNYEENFTVTSHANGDSINITAGATDALNNNQTDKYKLGTITVNSSTAGQVDLTIESTTTVTDANNSWYTITRQNGTLTVTSTNDPPTAEDDSYNIKSDDNDADNNTVLVVQAEDGVLQNDIDPNSDELNASVKEGPSNGDLGLMPDGSFVYVPNGGFTGTDTFTYEVRDGNGGTDTATVTIKIPGGAGGGGNGQGNS